MNLFANATKRTAVKDDLRDKPKNPASEMMLDLLDIHDMKLKMELKEIYEPKSN